MSSTTGGSARERARVDATGAEGRALRRLGYGLLGAATMLALTLAWLGVLAREPDTSLDGRQAPPFELALLSGDGTIDQSVLAGRVGVINVWASWCAPCREEAPVLRRVFERLDPREAVLIGVAHKDVPDSAREFVREFGIEYPNAIDDDSFGRAYGVRGLPMTFVVSPEGTIVATHFGPISESRLLALIEDASTTASSVETVRWTP